MLVGILGLCQHAHALAWQLLRWILHAWRLHQQVRALSWQLPKVASRLGASVVCLHFVNMLSLAWQLSKVASRLEA